jgi:hypothetical protein
MILSFKSIIDLKKTFNKTDKKKRRKLSIDVLAKVGKFPKYCYISR